MEPNIFVMPNNNNEITLLQHRKWLETEDIKGLLAEYESPKGWTKDFYYALMGKDRTGCPVIYAPFGKWDIQKEMALGNKEEFVKYVYHNMELLFTYVKRLSKKESHIKQVVGIIDLDGFSLRQCTSIDGEPKIISKHLETHI